MNCPNCGSELKEGQKFCLKCGVKIEEAGQTNVPKPPVFEKAGEVEIPAPPVVEENTSDKKEVDPSVPANEEGVQAMPSVPPMVKEEKVVQPEPEKETCPHCGAQVKAGLNFCTSCGKSMKETTEANTQTCPHCKAQVKAGLNFCTVCGKPMKKMEEEVKINTQEVAPKKSMKKWIVTAAIVVAVAVVGVGGYFLYSKWSVNGLASYAKETLEDKYYSEDALVEYIMKVKNVSIDSAKEAVKIADVDFKEIAVNKVKSYSEDGKLFSREGMIITLIKEDKFSEAEAEYAVDHADIDYTDNAKNQARNISEDFESKKSTLKILTEEYLYTEKQAEAGVADALIDFKEAAYQKGKRLDVDGKKATENALKDEGFKSDEIKYALNKLYPEEKKASNTTTNTTTYIISSSSGDVYRTNYDMNVRSGPSKSNSQVGYLTVGTQVTVYETRAGSTDGSSVWARIGTNQWVCMSDSQYSAYLSRVN